MILPEWKYLTSTHMFRPFDFYEEEILMYYSNIIAFACNAKRFLIAFVFSTLHFLLNTFGQTARSFWCMIYR